MAKNTCLLYAATRPRVLDVVYALTMLCAPEWVICDVGTHVIADIFVMHGVSAPISRGSPPLQTE